MRLKSYFAESVEAAVAQASKELGPEAMLVYSREAPEEARYLGCYEVVFSVPSPARQAAESQSQAKPQAPAEQPCGNGGAEQPVFERLSKEVATLRKQMERMASSLARAHSSLHPGGMNAGPMREILDALLDSGISAELVQEVATRLQQRLEVEAAAAEPAEPREILRRELAAMFSVDARLGSQDGGPSIVALVGPPGSGKTTTLVKLAVAYGLKSRRPAQLLSMDMCRVGGAEQLRSYAAILGIGFQALETPLALAQALEEHRHKDLILIDTPGHSERDMDMAEDLAFLLQSHSEVDTHLTLTASMKSADLERAADRYERFRPTKLLFTRLDETASLGTIFNESVRTGKPISFLANGQQIPEDLQPATKDRILDLILGGRSDEPAPLTLDTGPPRAPEPARKQMAGNRAAAA